MADTKLTENQVRQSGIYKVINKLFYNINGTLSLDMMHKRIGSGLKHNLAIYYNKTIDDQIVPCLAGWGNNAEKQLGIDLTGSFEKSFPSPMPIYLEHNRQQYYPITLSCGLNHSLVLAVRCGLMHDYVKNLNEFELQAGMGINQPEVLEQLQLNFMKDIKIFITGEIKYSNQEAMDQEKLERQQQKQKVVESFDNGLSIQINNASKQNILSNFPSPMQSSTHIPLLPAKLQEQKHSSFANQLTTAFKKEALQKKNTFLIKSASRGGEDDEDEEDHFLLGGQTQQQKSNFDLNIESNSKVNFKTIIDTIVDLSQIKSLNALSIIQITCGWQYCIILSNQYQVFAWGDNTFGNLGTGDIKSRIKPSLVLKELGKPLNARFIDCQAHHSAAITADGKLFTWGQGQYGQLGNGQFINLLIPTQVEGILKNKNIIQVSCGVFHTACVSNDGFTYTWGTNRNGQLGQGYDIEITLYPGLNGRIYACGSNVSNKLGLDYKQYFQNSKTIYIPIELNNQFLKGVSYSKINDVNIYQISSSLHSTFALSNKGYLTSWGLNFNAILGRQISTSISEEFCQLEEEYDDKIEGYNPKRYENIMIPNRLQIDYLGYNQQVFYPIQNQQIFRAKKKDFISSEFVDIKLGTFHSMGLTNAGEVFVWGSNTLGQHGCDEAQLNQAYSDQNISKIKINVNTLIMTALPTLVNFFDIQENRRVSYIACGADYCMAIENRRKVFGWGRNDSGQLGIGITSPIVYKPTQVQGLEGLLMKQISCGVQHTIFLSDDGHVFSCGSPVDGRLGLGQRDTIQLFPMKISSLSKIEKIACGQSHSLALGEDVFFDENESLDQEFQVDNFNQKVIYSWGNAFESKLGHGEKENLYEPNRIQSNYSFIDVFAGYHHSAAIDKDRNLIVWGPFQYFGYQKPEEKNPKNKRIEVNEFIRPTIHPRQQMLQQVQSVALGDKYSLVLNSINQVYQWGVFDKQYENKSNENKNLTRNQINESLMTTITKVSTPSSVITHIAVASNHAALISKSQLFSWGYDMNTGRLATGYEFYDQAKEEQKMIDDIYQDDSQEQQFKEKAFNIDLNHVIDHPQNSSYLNRYLQDKLSSFNLLQKQKIAQQKKKQLGKSSNVEQEKYKETHHDIPFDFQVDEEIEDEDDEEGGGGGGKDLNEEIMADFNNEEKKKRREQFKRKTQAQQTILTTKGNSKRTFARPSTIKRTVLYETSMIENAIQSKIFEGGSFNQNTKEFKKFKTLEKIYKKNSEHNSPTVKKEKQEEKQQDQFKAEVDPLDFYQDPIKNQTLYQEIMQQGKPELMSIIRDEDGYGIFSVNKIVDLYDKVINIQNEVNLYYLKFKEFQENQNKIKNVVKSKIFKRITEPPFNIHEIKNNKALIPTAFTNHKLSQSISLTHNNQNRVAIKFQVLPLIFLI